MTVDAPTARPRRLVAVVGTGTAVGKTWVTAGLARRLAARGVPVAVRKLAQSFVPGDLEAGAVATLVSTQFSIVSGGAACIAGAALLASLLPGFRRYDRRHPISRDEPEHQG